jgi:hypothetical protein
MSDSSINKIIEEFSHLPLEDKEYIAEIIKNQLVEGKRARLASRAEEARMNLEKGAVKTGTVEDMMEDLDRD